MPDYKKEAAEAALQFIHKETTIGFGAGSTIKHLIEFLKDDRSLADSVITLTASFATKKLLQQNGFKIQDPSVTRRIDQYFDGCDRLDRELNALKSGGGIHTMEKLLAAMAAEFIILGDESKYVEKLDAVNPLVIEVIPEGVTFVMERLREIFADSDAAIRLSDKKDGAVITEHGNYLIDLSFKIFPEPGSINKIVTGIPGVLEHSLFYNMAHKAIIAGPAGVKVILPG